MLQKRIKTVKNEKRTISNAYQVPPRWAMKKTNIEYKGHTKWLSYLTKKIFFGMILLLAYAQYIYIVNAKYHKPSVKALVQVDFPVYAQAKSLFKSKQEKNGSFQKAVILSKNIFLASNFFMQMFNESILCRQSIELFRHKLWYKLNSPHMHYLYTSYKIAKL